MQFDTSKKMSLTQKSISVDIGTSQAKMGVFESDTLIHKETSIKFGEIVKKVNQYKPYATIVSSVNQDPNSLINDIFGKLIILDHTTHLPITNNYRSQNTLGKDRLAAVVGAHSLFPNENCLVIDIGTCITYDFINAQAEYLGGSISPGIALKTKALNKFTANLPLIEDLEVGPLIGNTTTSAIQSGVINGTIAEINEIIRMYEYKFSTLRIIVCGGVAPMLQQYINTTTQLEENLVLIGLQKILKYND